MRALGLGLARDSQETPGGDAVALCPCRDLGSSGSFLHDRKRPPGVGKGSIREDRARVGFKRHLRGIYFSLINN